MTFGEKLKNARLALNLSQSEVAEMTGISERSLYSYEQTGVLMRIGNIRKLAEALQVSVGYLLDEEETDTTKDIDHDIFIANAKNEYGYKGVKEATDILSRVSTLFAGGNLDDSAKDLFFQSLTKIYLESKEEARAKFTPKQVRKKRTKEQFTYYGSLQIYILKGAYIDYIY
ncbi:MAG: helix-turn-helix domain-containing protein [Clostridia bacterium]